MSTNEYNIKLYASEYSYGMSTLADIGLGL